MPYILGVDEIHIITNDSNHYQYKHVNTDDFFVIYKDSSNTSYIIDKFIKDIIESDQTPATKVYQLGKLTHIPGVEMEILFNDYHDHRNKSHDTEYGWSWVRHYGWTHLKYNDGKKNQQEMSAYINSRFGRVYDVDPVLADYMNLHSATLWTYKNEDSIHMPTYDSMVSTQRIVIEHQINFGLLKGEVTRFPMKQVESENIITLVNAEPVNHQPGISF